MARLAMRVKDKKRIVMVKKFAAKRKDLRERAVNMKLSEEERFEARTKLNKMPKMTIQSRVRNRCANTGRVRGYLGKFGLCRNEFRRLASFGQIPGVTKASW